MPGTLASGRDRTVLLPLSSCPARPFPTPAAPPACPGLLTSATLWLFLRFYVSSPAGRALSPRGRGSPWTEKCQCSRRSSPSLGDTLTDTVFIRTSGGCPRSPPASEAQEYSVPWLGQPQHRIPLDAEPFSGLYVVLGERAEG